MEHLQKETLYKATDKQGAGFAENRQLTIEGWHQQAIGWCDIEEDTETKFYIQALESHHVLPYIAMYWDLTFTKIN